MPDPAIDWRAIPLYRVDGHLAFADAGQDLTFLIRRLAPEIDEVGGELQITVMAQILRALAWKCRISNSSLTKLAEVAIQIAQDDRENRRAAKAQNEP